LRLGRLEEERCASLACIGTTVKGGLTQGFAREYLPVQFVRHEQFTFRSQRSLARGLGR
jgi:hypothetical protein